MTQLGLNSFIQSRINTSVHPSCRMLEVLTFQVSTTTKLNVEHRHQSKCVDVMMTVGVGDVELNEVSSCGHRPAGGGADRWLSQSVHLAEMK